MEKRDEAELAAAPPASDPGVPGAGRIEAHRQSAGLLSDRLGMGGTVVTVMSDPVVAELGSALYAARRSGIPIEPLTDRHEGMSLTDAYRVQRDLVSRLLADGDRVVGYKLGLPSGPMQRMLGVDSPDFAPVLASHVHPAAAQEPA